MKNKLKKILFSVLSVFLIIGVIFGAVYFIGHTYFGADALVLAEAPETVSQSRLDKTYIESVQALGAKTLPELMKAGNTVNQIISPLGMSLCYSMLLNGADGETYNELKNLLSYGNMTGDEINKNNAAAYEKSFLTDKSIKLRIANAIWFDKGYTFKQSFLDVCKNNFYADLYKQDFTNANSVKGNVNKWVKNKSNGKIESILDKVSSDDRMYLLSSIYFEGKWKDPFDKKKTAKQDFHMAGGGTVSCDFMHGKENVKYKKSEEFTAVSVPYNGGLSMVLAMPNDNGQISGLFDEDLIKTILRYNDWTYGETTDEDDQLREESSMANLIMPKFSFSRDMNMIPVLQSLGVKEAFTMDANFSKADDENNLYVGQIKQKTFIDVNEEKTIAVAINFVSLNEKSDAPMQVPDVVFDRPFIFAIVDESGLPLFMGVINNPVA